MMHFVVLFFGLAAFGIAAPPEESEVVFRSDVSLARVDAQVIGRDQQAVTGLSAEDLVLLVNGEPQEIRNFGNEDMPVDVLLLLDVSGSMRSHIERLSSAAEQALRVLGEQDRVAIMVFDRGTRIRMPFRSSHQEVMRGLDGVINQEGFNNGTDIPRALSEAARYVMKEARKDARRAIVVLTDDQTERRGNNAAIDRDLAEANAVLSLLLAPDATYSRSGPYGGSRRGGYGGGWPGSGGPMGGPLGGIIFGRRGPYGGGGNGPVIISGPQMQSADTAGIARRSGGDSMSIDNASAFEDTLARIRQRYTLHYYLPEAVAGQAPRVEVQLAAAASRRYANAEIRYRRISLSQDDGSSTGGPVEVSKTRPVPVGRESKRTEDDTGTDDRSGRLRRRRPAVDEPVRPLPGQDGPGQIGAPGGGGWRRVEDPAPAEAGPSGSVRAEAPAGQTAPPEKTGGWRRVKPGEQP